MKYWIRQTTYTEMPWYYWLVCKTCDWYDDYFITPFHISDNNWLLDILAGWWCDIVFKFKENKHEVHDDSCIST